MKTLASSHETGEMLGGRGRPAPAASGILIVAPTSIQRRVRMLLHPHEFAVAAMTEPPLTIESAAEVCGVLERAPQLAILFGGKELYSPGGPAELLRTLLPESRLVVLSPCAERDMLSRALRAGARAVVCEDRLEQTLAAVLRAVEAGQVCVPGSLTRRLDTGAFSARERQVLDLITSGLTNAQIAARLYLSESTVKSHLASSFRKLGLCSRAEAAAAWSEVLDDEAEQRETLERIAAYDSGRVSLLSDAFRAPVQSSFRALLGAAS